MLGFIVTSATLWPGHRAHSLPSRLDTIWKSGHPRQDPYQSLAPVEKGWAELETKMRLIGPIGVQHTPGTLDTQPHFLGLLRIQGSPTLGWDDTYTWAGRASVAGK